MRCPECGVMLGEGERRCDFCGTIVVPAQAAGPAAPPPPSGAGGRLRAAYDLLAALGFGCLALGAIYLLATRGGDGAGAPPPRPAATRERLAQELCEEGVRRQVRAPLRVIGFRSALVGEHAGGGFTVSGTVELQSVVGEVQLRRYGCRLRPGGGAGLVLEEGGLR